MTEKVQPTERLKFKWASFSPDPHDITMRNNLEPVEVFVEIEVPLKKEYFANIERLIKVSLGVSDEVAKVSPILTREGMRFVTEELSLRTSSPEPDVEDLDDEDWDDDNLEDSLDTVSNDDDDFDDDEDWDEE